MKKTLSGDCRLLSCLSFAAENTPGNHSQFGVELFFRSFVAVSEVYLKNYFDRSLSGALADQVGRIC